MAIDDSDIRLVRKGWATAVAAADQTAQSFYANLFRIAPGTRPLFREDIDVQGRKLVETLDFIVDHLDELDTLLPAARDLAIRHTAYGVQTEHYDHVGTALITTLQDLLGRDFTDEDQAAWTRVYGTLSGQMIAATSA
ncbi:globin domain-containing protein [Pontivivens insulae]|uniref:Bacterial hemoglobin n=1 Tax=Pontivivens insulae TaxID=1639689 RepID=A0A2R8A7H0_9RHOB|nr:globin domain-containing protein [Pontivivens insulae]RED18073.1 hemoglobin-like flavoprotein [Pontivivens insulae]SPF27970.1 Bacterial hemoglobin [Pontivivens insulae]